MQLPQTIFLATLFVLATSTLTYGMFKQPPQTSLLHNSQASADSDLFEKKQQQQQLDSTFTPIGSTTDRGDSSEKKTLFQKLKGFSPLKGIRSYRKKKVSQFAKWLDSKFGEGPELVVNRDLEVPQEEDCDTATKDAKQAKLKAAKAFKQVCIAIQEQLKDKSTTTLQTLESKITTALELYKVAQDLNKKRKTTPSSIWDAALIGLRRAKLMAYGKIVPSLPKMARTVGLYQSVAKKYEWLKTHAKQVSSAIGTQITRLRNKLRKDGGQGVLIQKYEHFRDDVTRTQNELLVEGENQFRASQSCSSTSTNLNGNDDKH